ncbi:zinc finger protein 608 isoform X1 [Colossoma macropomum]|uniref:zinc finger protein 608 isoform X1 n=1 Tax=Colossoma macropomum TaxID=42526 RepID=UPI00186414CD|nr:zinc finger protein 608 isoform X1 [Colossoma macropomum]
MWRMSVTSSVERSVKLNGADAYDSGDEWEIGLGDLIIDLDADLEKDRRKSEMNSRALAMKGAEEAGEEELERERERERALDGLAGPGAQPAAARASLCKEARKFKEKRRHSAGDGDAEAFTPAVGKRREPQGRPPGEVSGMNAAAAAAVVERGHPEQHPGDVNGSCAKGKEGKRGRNQGRGLKREAKESARARKDRHGGDAAGFGLGPVPQNDGWKEKPCYCGDSGAGDLGRGAMDAGMRAAGAIVADKAEGACSPERAHKTLSIKTRSVGTNTQEAERAIESNYMEPCQPGTSVNLEGIVWHETEEGVLVVNVTWRKRTYVGTLLDCTKHDWAPPRFCESPMSDSDMPCGRGRGKRMRLAVSDQPVVEPGLSKIRGLTHKRRGVGIGNKGRRGSLNLSTCRTPAYYSVEDIKSSPLICGKRKGKAPADLDLSLVAEDVRNGNGKRIRAKSRSAPSTPQGKSDPAFLDQVCASPMLIDCPHPNCNKKYKHINGLRYHQSHAHLDSDSKQEFEAESEDRLSDYEEPLSNVAFDSSENLDIMSKKPRTMYKLSSGGSPKSRKLLLNSEHSPTANAKPRRNMVGKEGPIDDLSNLPLISNMSVVLENCLITDRNSSVEMPKLEAEGVIDKREVKKENETAERCSAKARANRLIANTPAPPKLIAIPTTFPTKITDGSFHQPSPTVTLTKAKNLSLKPIKPKLDIVAQVNMANAAIVLSKESKRKDKHRLKDRNCKDPRSPKTDPVFTKADDTKSIGKDFPVSLLKEHLSKQDVVNGPSESQESRMASIRAEADKVYTFTDNAPSPSIGSSARMDPGTLSNGDSNTTKTNSPAYSDISDVAEDGGLNSRSRRNSAPDSNLNGNINPKIPCPITPVTAAQSSSHSHGYESYGLPGYMHSGQSNSAAFLKVSTPYSRTKEDARDLNEDLKNSESSADASSQSQLQLAMTQTQTALAQSLYYGQYTRNVPADQKVLIVPNTHRQQNETCCDDVQYSKQSRVQARRGPEQKERTKEDTKQMITSSVAIHKGTNSVKISCAKPGFIYVELDKHQQPQAKSSLMSMAKDQGHNKESEDFNPESQNTKTNVDTNVTYLNASESQSWSHSFQSKYVKQQNQEVNKVSQEIGPDKVKDWRVPPDPESRLEAELQNVKCETPSEDMEEGTRAEAEEMPSETSEDSQSMRVAVSSSQQSYIQYQHSYPYLHLCEANNSSFRVMSPALVHNYPGFHYPLYGKTAGREDSEGTQNSKPVTDPTALELLPHHNLPYHGKSPVPGERGSPDEDRETEQERETVPFAHHLHTHHHTHLGMSYTLVSGQYDPYQGEKKN